jgi:8-oxo-dGTP pyrophosphatase MutT (NUDIX family)
MFRSCKDPIISCGILLLRGIYEPLCLPVDPKEVSVLMVRRKDSMAFMEFVRGKYEFADNDYVRMLLSNMTALEHQLISEKNFEKLWRKLWGNGRELDSDEYKIASAKFESLTIDQLLSDMPAKFKDPEWGFPKGRRARGESDVECAVREFHEETNIEESAYKVFPNISFSETFVGTNGVSYRHVYFVALLKDSRQFNLEAKLTAVQRREVSAVEWKSLKECRQITRPHYTERKKLISELEKKVKTQTAV